MLRVSYPLTGQVARSGLIWFSEDRAKEPGRDVYGFPKTGQNSPDGMYKVPLKPGG